MLLLGERTCLKGRQARENPALRTKEQESKHRSKRSSYLWQRKRVTLQLVKPEQARDPVSAGPNIYKRTGSSENHSSPMLLENSGPTIDFLHPYFPQTGESTAATWHSVTCLPLAADPVSPVGVMTVPWASPVLQNHKRMWQTNRNSGKCFKLFSSEDTI